MTVAEAKNTIRTIEEQVVVLTLTVDEARRLARVLQYVEGSPSMSHIDCALAQSAVGSDYDIEVTGCIVVKGEVS